MDQLELKKIKKIYNELNSIAKVGRNNYLEYFNYVDELVNKSQYSLLNTCLLLNYGIDECRFTKPVYPGSSIAVRFTCKEKIEQEKKNPEDVAKGIVKFLVDVYDETGETVAIATILTMVKKRNQN